MTKPRAYRSSGWENEANYCRAHRLLPGTRLVGDEGRGPIVIRITALGAQRLLAVTESHNGYPSIPPRESSWTLSCRDWRRVTS